MRKIITFLCICIVLTGCTKYSDIENVSEGRGAEGNPFDLQEIEAENSSVDASYGWWITNYDNKKRIIDYSGKSITLDIRFDNVDAACESGIVIFIDGIAQQYKINNSGKERYIHTITLGEKSRKDISLTFIPKFAGKAREHEMYVASIYNPEYRASKENPGYGNYGNLLPGLAWKINYNSGDNMKLADVQVVYKELTDDIKSKYISQNNSGMIINKLDSQLVSNFIQDGKKIMGSEVNTSKKLTVQLFGGEEVTYRICAMIDNELGKVFSGNAYCDVTIKKNKITEFELDFNKVSKRISDYSSLYFMLCPMADDGFNEDFLIDKTNSLYLLTK